MSEETRDKTKGEDMVRVSFNPSEDPVVKDIKEKTAELIDLVEAIRSKNGRLASLAQTSYEQAAMWGVKLATSVSQIDKKAE